MLLVHDTGWFTLTVSSVRRNEARAGPDPIETLHGVLACVLVVLLQMRNTVVGASTSRPRLYPLSWAMADLERALLN